MMSERERIARLIRMHIYDWQYGTCMCVYSRAQTTDFTRMSIVEHSLHVADTIQHRRHNIEEVGDPTGQVGKT